MKNKFHGGTSALIQTATNMKKFTSLLNLTVRPFIFETSEIDFSTLLFVNNKGELKAIKKSKLN